MKSMHLISICLHYSSSFTDTVRPLLLEHRTCLHQHLNNTHPVTYRKSLTIHAITVNRLVVANMQHLTNVSFLKRLDSSVGKAGFESPGAVMWVLGQDTMRYSLIM